MPQPPVKWTDEIGFALSNLGDVATGVFTPTLRLGVTGLSRAGKTIFITALVHDLLTNQRLAAFSPVAEGRLIGAVLSEHPDRQVPRFAYEQHLKALTGSPPHWPESTRRISQIRITLKFQSKKLVQGMMGPSQVHLDIVDYPGEWLLDLPLLSLSYAEWSEQALARARQSSSDEARAFLVEVDAMTPGAEARDADAERLAAAFAEYLRMSRHDGRTVATVPPGRFLMPGDLEGSPALTFAPLPALRTKPDTKSLYAMLARRYQAYKDVVVRPFFRDHFARLDRQIVLVDALRAVNGGPEAVADLETALTEILTCFRQGATNPLINVVMRRIDRILFAASKADHIHHTSHDRLEAILNRVVSQAARRAKFAGAETRSLAIAAIRATREDTIPDKAGDMPVIVGTPEKGEVLDGQKYDGKTQIALFPGDLPVDPDAVFTQEGAEVSFLRFLPPHPLDRTEHGDPVLPHIRLDRALEFLLGDWLR